MLSHTEYSWLKAQAVGEIIAVEQFKEALTNVVFLITTHSQRQFVFKRLNRKARSDADRHSEYQVQQLASQHGLTPKVIAHNKDFKLQQYIQGSIITNQHTDLSALLASQLHRIHQLPAQHAPKQRLLFELKRLKEQLPSSIDEIRFQNMCNLATKLDCNCPCDTLCHGDLSLNNILQSDTKNIYILDWEYAVIASPAYDLAFCNCINALTASESKSVIEHYFSQLNCPVEYTLEALIAECDLYFELFNYINELWSLCFIDKG